MNGPGTGLGWPTCPDMRTKEKSWRGTVARGRAITESIASPLIQRDVSFNPNERQAT